MIVHHIFIKANTPNLTDDQREELANIRDKYLYPMAHKDLNFHPAEVKAEVKASNDINLDMANMSVDALVAIRKAIGVENFKETTKMMPMMGRNDEG